MNQSTITLSAQQQICDVGTAYAEKAIIEQQEYNNKILIQNIDSSCEGWPGQNEAAMGGFCGLIAYFVLDFPVCRQAGWFVLHHGKMNRQITLACNPSMAITGNSIPLTPLL